jgi:peroxiredoxin
MDFFVGRKVVLVCVPGAFTTKSSEKHLPGYFELLKNFADKDVSIVVVSVNDPFVMQAWAQALMAKGAPECGGSGVIFLADGAGSCARALGLDMRSMPCGELRMRRASIYVDDGVVKVINVEENGAFTELSGAAFMLSQIG